MRASGHRRLVRAKKLTRAQLAPVSLMALERTPPLENRLAPLGLHPSTLELHQKNIIHFSRCRTSCYVEFTFSILTEATRAEGNGTRTYSSLILYMLFPDHWFSHATR